MFDAFKVGEKWTTVIPSTIDVDFFDSVGDGIGLLDNLPRKYFLSMRLSLVKTRKKAACLIQIMWGCSSTPG